MCGKHLVKPVTNAVEGRGGDFFADPKGVSHGGPRWNAFGRTLEVLATAGFTNLEMYFLSES